MLLKLLKACLHIVLAVWTGTLSAQVSIPPYAGNQKASVTQHMGLVSVTINYSSPNVISPLSGEDRTGKIWGGLVPNGFNREPWFEMPGEKREAPWRAGANENTTITFSHPVKVEGQLLAAGTYALLMAPDKDEWTVVFSKNPHGWGNYFYNPEQDALRVKVKPQQSEFHPYLTYEFTDRKVNGATAMLLWENLKVPFKIETGNVHDLYVARMQQELQGTNRIFYWQDWNEAAKYCLKNKTHLEKGLEWAEKAISHPWVGEPNFTSLKTKAELLNLLNRQKEAEEILQFALHHAATVYEVHHYGKELLGKSREKEALAIFKMNAKNHPNIWPVNLGLARGYAAVGDYDKALKYINLAKNQVPQANKFTATNYEYNLLNIKQLTEKIKKKEKLPLYLFDEGLTQVY